MVSETITALLWFVAVVAAIPLALWLLKRTPLAAARAGAPLRQVGMLPLSNTQRLVTVEVGEGEQRRWLVLGVTPQSISTLHTMQPQADMAGTPAAVGIGAAPAFAQLLGRLKGTSGGAGGSDDARR